MKLTKKQKKDIDDLLIKVINESNNNNESKNFDLTDLSKDEVVEIIRNMGDNDTISITVINKQQEQ
jgi:hypothetical protein